MAAAVGAGSDWKVSEFCCLVRVPTLVQQAPGGSVEEAPPDTEPTVKNGRAAGAAGAAGSGALVDVSVHHLRVGVNLICVSAERSL